MTELGKERVSACACTASSLSLLATMNCAKSPTTLEEGVTCSRCVRGEQGRRRWMGADLEVDLLT